jgi:uncharacterized membrane protein YuzA (DUF378 family)
MDEKTIGLITMILIVIGAINWGLFGLMNIDLVTLIAGKTILARLVYILIGAAGVYEALVMSKVLK